MKHQSSLFTPATFTLGIVAVLMALSLLVGIRPAAAGRTWTSEVTRNGNMCSPQTPTTINLSGSGSAISISDSRPGGTDPNVPGAFEIVDGTFTVTWTFIGDAPPSQSSYMLSAICDCSLNSPVNESGVLFSFGGESNCEGFHERKDFQLSPHQVDFQTWSMSWTSPDMYVQAYYEQRTHASSGTAFVGVPIVSVPASELSGGGNN